jgi:hypothetical protein
MATTTKSSNISNPTQTGRTKEDIPTLKNKVAEVKKKEDFVLV